MHSFRFAVQLARATSGEDWARSARRAETIGYDVMVMPDHLGHQLSPLAGLAATTTRLRVCAFVLANDYRNPLLLAREAATLDLLSGGRFQSCIPLESNCSAAATPSGSAITRFRGMPWRPRRPWSRF